MRNRTRLLTALALVGAIVISSCGDDDDDDASSAATTIATSEAAAATTAAPDTTTPADTAGADTSAPADTSDASDTTEATETTEGGASADLAPQPLAERQSIKVGMSGPLENYMPVLLADANGEFEAENIDVELVYAPPTDQVQLLAAGQIDASVQAIGLASFNAISSGVDMRFVFPMAARGEPKSSGWWVRNDVMGDDDFQGSDLNGQTLISPSGATGLSPAILIPQLVEEDPEFDPTSVKQDRMALADMPIALINGAVGAAQLTAPFWQPVEESGCCTFIDYFVDWPTTEIILNRRLLDDPETTTAFLRAVTRTTEENLRGDYHSNAALVTQMSELLQQPEEAILAVAPLVFLGEMNTEEMLATQEYYRTIEGAVSYPEDLTEEQVFDLTWTEELLGQGA